ncbi:MAG: hypothetical protein WBD10_07085 [Acidobacteriaceae bacterium]
MILNLPPRTLKSHAASVAFPAWLLDHDPAKQIICASYWNTAYFLQLIQYTHHIFSPQALPGQALPRVDVHDRQRTEKPGHSPQRNRACEGGV